MLCGRMQLQQPDPSSPAVCSTHCSLLPRTPRRTGPGRLCHNCSRKSPTSSHVHLPEGSLQAGSSAIVADPLLLSSPAVYAARAQAPGGAPGDRAGRAARYLGGAPRNPTQRPAACSAAGPGGLKLAVQGAQRPEPPLHPPAHLHRMPWQGDMSDVWWSCVRGWWRLLPTPPVRTAAHLSSSYVQVGCADTQPAYTDRHGPATEAPCFAGHVDGRAAGQAGRWLSHGLQGWPCKAAAVLEACSAHHLRGCRETCRLLMLASSSTGPECKCFNWQVAGQVSAPGRSPGQPLLWSLCSTLHLNLVPSNQAQPYASRRRSCS